MRCMSRSFLRFFKTLFNADVSVYSNNPMTNKIIGCIGLSTILGHGMYAFTTAETKMIGIRNKYTFDRNGFTEFMVIDDNGNHYNVNNSFWYWKWNSIEDWHKLEPKNDVIIKYYGWRAPLFGLFPNIIMSNKASIGNETI